VEGQIRPLVTRSLAGRTRAAILSSKRTALAEAGECRVRGVGDHEDVTATSTVAAVGTTIGDVLLVAEADGSAPS
jgi:hypothetical protein